jgi:hypothetical protein
VIHHFAASSSTGAAESTPTKAKKTVDPLLGGDDSDDESELDPLRQGMTHNPLSPGPASVKSLATSAIVRTPFIAPTRSIPLDASASLHLIFTPIHHRCHLHFCRRMLTMVLSPGASSVRTFWPNSPQARSSPFLSCQTVLLLLAVPVQYRLIRLVELMKLHRDAETLTTKELFCSVLALCLLR